MITCLEFWVTSPWYHTCSRQIASNSHVFFPTQPVSPSTPTSSRYANVASAATTAQRFEEVDVEQSSCTGPGKISSCPGPSNMIGFISWFIFWTTLWKPLGEYMWIWYLLGMNRKPELTSLTVIAKIENLLDPVYGASCDEERRSLAYPSYSPSSSSNSPSSSAVASSLKDMFSATYMGKSEILYFIAST